MNPADSSSTKTIRTLYVCYFGVREPLVRTQVIPYLRELSAGGIEVSLLTFEPRLGDWTRQQIAEQRELLKTQGINWSCLKYHKWPSLPATLYDIARGTFEVIRIMRRQQISVLHARNHVPALMCVIAKKVRPARLVFDIRGFMPEEYTDAGVWPANGYIYCGVKRVERYLFRVADAFIVLTEKARQILFPGATDFDQLGRPIEVIPCCVDLDRFEAVGKINRDELRDELGVQGRRVIAYAGSFLGWYMTDEMLAFLSVACQQDPSTFVMILTQSPKDEVVRKIRAAGIDERSALVTGVKPEEIPKYLHAADIAISFIKACYSKQSSSPTKIAEYLASGLPIVCNAGVGDLDQLLADDRVGVILHGFTREAYLQALVDIDTLRRDPTFPAHARAVAREQFDLAGVGGPKYRRLYSRLLKQELPAASFAREIAG